MNTAERQGGANVPTNRRLLRGARRAVALSAVLAAVGAGGSPGDSVDAAPPDASARDAAYVMSDVHCSRAGDGVLDLTLVNDSPDRSAQFEVDGADPSTSAAVLVAPMSAHALAFTALPDGERDVPVRVDGTVELVHVTVACDAPRLRAGLTAEAVEGSAPVGTPRLPRAGGDVDGFVVGGVLVAAGIAASLLARRRYS